MPSAKADGIVQTMGETFGEIAEQLSRWETTVRRDVLDEA
jgi:hypothetical protein